MYSHHLFQFERKKKEVHFRIAYVCKTCIILHGTQCQLAAAMTLSESVTKP